METAGTYKITRQGQITIPSKIRETMQLREGDTLDFYYGDDLILIKKKKTPLEIFDEIAARAEKRFKENKITRKDVRDAIQHARRQ